MAKQTPPINLGIYVYDNAEVLDFSGPFEVFSVANRLTSNPLFNVFLFSEYDWPQSFVKEGATN